MEGASPTSVVKWYVDAAEEMLDADIAANMAIGNFGADAILSGRSEQSADGAVTVMTICNTGSLATAGYGTALGVVRALHSRDLLKQVSQC